MVPKIGTRTISYAPERVLPDQIVTGMRLRLHTPLPLDGKPNQQVIFALYTPGSDPRYGLGAGAGPGAGAGAGAGPFPYRQS